MVVAIEVAGTANANLEAETPRETLEAEGAALEARAADLTAAMERRTAAKAGAIARAVMPVDGLGFGDCEVVFNGLPLDQADPLARRAEVARQLDAEGPLVRPVLSHGPARAARPLR